MELSENKAVIVSCGIGNWYGQGVRRLVRTLNFECWGGSIISYIDEYPPDCPPHIEIPYYFKIAAIEQAIKQGYTHILWADASMVCVKNPGKLFDIINEQGYWFFSTGYNLAQSVNDAALYSVGLSRDDAEQANEWASGLVGFNLTNPDGKNLYNTWKEYMDMGLSVGNKAKNQDESIDHRFLAHRQDQSCLALSAYKHKLVNTKGLDFVSYKGTGYNPDEIMFFIEGLA